MKSLFFFLLFCALVVAQDPTYYYNARNENHLCGPFQIEAIEKDSLYSPWFQANYDAAIFPSPPPKWVKKFRNTSVEIYMGTWCGDSKKWVPQFVKLWDSYGLDRSKLSFTALYDTDEKYKQGPNGEEKGKRIHRVPTFIFNRDGKEYARIVESPRNDLETDLQQIALGVASEPNYRGASYLLNLLQEKTTDEIYKEVDSYFQTCYRLVCKSSELNTLGYVFLYAGEIKKALLTFDFNRYYFRNDPNVYSSLAEALLLDNNKDKAIENYNKALQMDPDNKAIKEKLVELDVEMKE